MRRLLAELWLDESGATSIEYALIVAIVSLSIVVALGSFRDSLNGFFNNVNTNISR
jgi:pilus assembly protein Flp/PilA